MSLFKISLMTQFRHEACHITIKEIVGIQAAYGKDFQAVVEEVKKICFYTEPRSSHSKEI